MLVAQEVASQLIRAQRPSLDAVERHDKDLANQLRRAGSSVLMNVSEAKKRIGKDRAHLFRIAAGSAEEVRAALSIATGWGYLTDASVASALALLDRELALLWGLTRRKS